MKRRFFFFNKIIEPGRLRVVPRGRHVAVKDGGAVVEVGPRKVLVGCRSGHRSQAEVPELTFAFFWDERDHAPTLKQGEKYHLGNAMLSKQIRVFLESRKSQT